MSILKVSLFAYIAYLSLSHEAILRRESVYNLHVSSNSNASDEKLAIINQRIKEYLLILDMLDLFSKYLKIYILT